METIDTGPAVYPPAMRALRINDTAPDFSARTTQGEKRLSDYRGRWLVLFSHPADFTPVCTSEFVALARQADAFAAIDCDLMALSVDRLYSHLAWLKDIFRSVDELLRLATALQPSDREAASTPAGWTPGDALLEPAATTLDAAIADGEGDAPWYYRERRA